jgi:hypothetical protein
MILCKFAYFHRDTTSRGTLFNRGKIENGVQLIEECLVIGEVKNRKWYLYNLTMYNHHNQNIMHQQR